MKKYVFTIKDDVCAANGKDVEATALLEKMRLWGDVEEYDAVVASVRAEYQVVVDNLTAQINAIKEQELTADEITLLTTYRACKKANGDAYQARIDELERQAERDRADYLDRAEKISLLLNRE
jgi:hypothetical protein